MPISRMQNPRQLYGLGSIVKSIGKGVKSIIKSPLGKAAILGFGANALMGGGGLSAILGKMGMTQPGSGFGGGSGIMGLFGKAKNFIGNNKLLSAGAAIGLGGAFGGMEDEQVEELKGNPEALKQYLAQYYSNLNKNATQAEVDNFVQTNTAEYRANGGRIGYASGSDPVILPKAKPRESDGKRVLDLLAKNKKASQNTLGSKTLFNLVGQNAAKAYKAGDISKSQYDSMMKPFFGEPSERLSKKISEERKELRANGGRMGYAYGSGDIVDQASGIMGLPQRTNSEGIKELDLRDSGGFIPPVGVKEKADDVPAMLSNNEFVMTADAVRGMGGGDVNRGAQRLYDQMKMLEKGGRV